MTDIEQEIHLGRHASQKSQKFKIPILALEDTYLIVMQ
jgi:hypothetical protein